MIKESVTRHDKLLVGLQQQLNQLLTWKRKVESAMQENASRQVESLERKVLEVARACEERNEQVNLLQKIEKSVNECAKQVEFVNLFQDVAH